MHFIALFSALRWLYNLPKILNMRFIKQHDRGQMYPVSYLREGGGTFLILMREVQKISLGKRVGGQKFCRFWENHPLPRLKIKKDHPLTDQGFSTSVEWSWISNVRRKRKIPNFDVSRATPSCIYSQSQEIGFKSFWAWVTFTNFNKTIFR